MVRFLLLFALLCTSAPAFSQNQVRFSDIKRGMQDDELEYQAIKLANKQAAAYQWPEEFSRATIVSSRWTILYDKNGFAKARKIHMQLYGRMLSGKCAMANFIFKQNILPDETFSDKLRYHSVGDILYVDCED
jgi:hypothetical protein